MFNYTPKFFLDFSLGGFLDILIPQGSCLWPSCYPSLLRCSLPVSMDGDCLQACLTLTAAQAGLADGLIWLRIPTTSHGSGALLEGGESLVAAGMGLPVPVRSSQFLPGRLGFLGGGMERGGLGEGTILAAAAGPGPGKGVPVLIPACVWLPDNQKGVP
jgi:hypothetical protein